MKFGDRSLRDVIILLLVLAVAEISATEQPIADYRGSSNGRRAKSGDVPDATNFLSRAYHATAVIGDFLYIDGGEIAYISDGQKINVPDNNTYSIDLRKPWTNSTITFQTIAKIAPVLNYFPLWTDKIESKIYQYGGEQSWALSEDTSPPLPSNSLWRLVPDGNGSGKWTQVTSSGFDDIVRPAAGIGISGAHCGVILGGYQSRRSSDSARNALTVVDFVPQPGIVLFNFTSQTWSNRSAAGYSEHGTAQYGGGHIINGFGDYDIFLFLGGSTSDRVQWKDDGKALVSFDAVHLYDPYIDEWYVQETSGAIPESRDRFCTVGLRGDNNTYEIVIYGGHVASSDGTEPQASASQTQKQTNIAMDEVFVLSLPGFVWTKAEYPATSPRIGHSCEVVGNRQMIVIGGRNPAANNQSDLVYSPDTWTNGVGLFDLTALRWRAQYNPDAKTYETPDAIKAWYSQNGMYPSQWNSNKMQTYFSVRRGDNGTTDDNGSGSNQTTTAPASDPSNSSTASSNNIGAIAGGVIGSLVGLGLVGTLAWWLFHRRVADTDHKVELGATEVREDPGTARPVEKEAEILGPELDTIPFVHVQETQLQHQEMMQPEPRPEMPDNQLRHELPS